MSEIPDRIDDEPLDIETMSLDRPIACNEGLDADHASRMRMQFLVGQYASLITQTHLRAAFVMGAIDLLLIVLYVVDIRLG